MQRIDLVAATLEGWSRASPAQREKFLKAGVKAALRLGGPEFRRWLRRRVRQPPLAAPIDPACFAISEADLAALLKTLGGEPRHQPSRIDAAEAPRLSAQARELKPHRTVEKRRVPKPVRSPKPKPVERPRFAQRQIPSLPTMPWQDDGR